MQASYARNEIMVVRVELEDMRKEVGRLQDVVAAETKKSEGAVEARERAMEAVSAPDR